MAFTWRVVQREDGHAAVEGVVSASACWQFYFSELIPTSETYIIRFRWSSIDLERRGAVAIVTLNNPDARNALDLEMRRALLATFRDLAEARTRSRAVRPHRRRRRVLLWSGRRRRWAGATWPAPRQRMKTMRADDPRGARGSTSRWWPRSAVRRWASASASPWPVTWSSHRPSPISRRSSRRWGSPPTAGRSGSWRGRWASRRPRSWSTARAGSAATKRMRWGW